jgi:CheY-like chemotaxis protein
MSAEQLAPSVGDRPSDREREVRLNSLARLASGLAHELNNALTPMLVAVQLLRKDPPPDQRAELLDAARGAVTRGTELVRRLLMLAGTGECERAVVRPERIIDEARLALERAEAGRLRCRVEVAEGLWAISGDAAQLAQAINHLVENARQAVTDDGQITLAAANAAAIPPDLAAENGVEPGRFVVLSVADDGCGIEAEVLDRIFDPFFTTRPFGAGLGLGLALARGIVRSQGGFIRVESTVGRGSRFSVYVPGSGDAEPAIAPAHPPRRGKPGEVVLVVDDEPAIARLAQITLEMHGYKALVAGSGDEALAVYLRHHRSVRVVVLDLMMPDMDGAATLAALRAISPTVRVIAASGRPSTVAGQVQGFLAKPYDPRSLLALVGAVLDAPP